MNPEKSPGGGALQPSSSDAVLVVLLAAREKMIRHLVTNRSKTPDYREREANVLHRLVAYASAEVDVAMDVVALIFLPD